MPSLIPFNPQEAVKKFLLKLPSRRMRDVLEKRFALKGGKKTLEEIGREYKITRERVRQIEENALRHVSSADFRKEKEDEAVFSYLENYLRQSGEVAAERAIIAELAGGRGGNHLLFLFHVDPRFHKLEETDEYYARWALNKETARLAEKAVSDLVSELGRTGKVLSAEKLEALAAKSVSAAFGSGRPPRVLNSYLGISRLIAENPYGEFGLVSWPNIRPRWVRDRAYLVMLNCGKPMHFLKIAAAINGVPWHKTLNLPRKKAHPQTVHNELIKDGRFVLVGRGIYALREWGHEPGVVRDVIASVLKQAETSLSSEEVVRLVSEKRLVRPQTILLNLQNKSFFRRTGDGNYALA